MVDLDHGLQLVGRIVGVVDGVPCLVGDAIRLPGPSYLLVVEVLSG